MRAYNLERYGGPHGALLADVRSPAMRPRDILVAVRAAGLNPVDFKIRQGMLRVVLSLRLPIVLGNELAGEVVAVGPQVRRFVVGDRIFARVEKERLGAIAEQVAVDEACASPCPRTWISRPPQLCRWRR